MQISTGRGRACQRPTTCRSPVLARHPACLRQCNRTSPVTVLAGRVRTLAAPFICAAPARQPLNGMGVIGPAFPAGAIRSRSAPRRFEAAAPSEGSLWRLCPQAVQVPANFQSSIPAQYPVTAFHLASHDPRRDMRTQTAVPPAANYKHNVLSGDLHRPWTPLHITSVAPTGLGTRL